MPKFTAEIDTDTKECQFYINGQALPLMSFSIGFWTYTDCNNNIKHSKNVSYSWKGDDGAVKSVNYCLDDDNQYLSNSDINKELVKIIVNHIAAQKLSSALAEVKRVMTIKLPTREMMTDPKNATPNKDSDGD